LKTNKHRPKILRGAQTRAKKAEAEK